jgi:hypothetical protein
MLCTTRLATQERLVMAVGHLAIVTDLTLADWVGGGTLVNDYFAAQARANGWQVSFICNNCFIDGWQIFDHSEVDAYFVANIPHLPPPYLLQMIQSGKPYVVFRHDIASLCYEPQPDRNSSAPLIQALFAHARANFFISNLQLSYYQRVCEVPRSVLVPPPLDLSNFWNQNNPLRQGHLYLGEISRPRGVDESIRAMLHSCEPGEKLLVGQLTDEALRASIHASGAVLRDYVSHNLVPTLMNQYAHFYYHPRIVDAFCLKVLEAELCGMELHVRREHIGRFFYRESAFEIAEFMRTESARVALRVLGSG